MDWLDFSEKIGNTGATGLLAWLLYQSFSMVKTLTEKLIKISADIATAIAGLGTTFKKIEETSKTARDALVRLERDMVEVKTKVESVEGVQKELKDKIDK